MKTEKLSSVFDGIGNVVGYYPDVRHIAGSINSAIYLCQVYYWSREASEGGWVSRTQREIEESTGLSRREQETAKALLVEQGLIDEQCRGKSNRTHLRFNREVAIAAWNNYLETGFSASDSRKQKRSKSTKTNLKQRGMAETDKAALHVSDKAKGDRSNPYSVELAQNRQSDFHENDNGGNRQTALYVTDTSLCTLQTNPLYTKEFKDLSLRGNSQILEGGEVEKKASQIELASNSQEGDRNSTKVNSTQEVASTPERVAWGLGERYSAAADNSLKNKNKAAEEINAAFNQGLAPWKSVSGQIEPGFIDFVMKGHKPDCVLPPQSWAKSIIRNDRERANDLWEEYQLGLERQRLGEERRQQAIAQSTATYEPPAQHPEEEWADPKEVERMLSTLIRLPGKRQEQRQGVAL